MLIDEVIVTVKAGNGGNGAATFKRNAQTPKGGPDGGNGGNGGSVFVVGVNDISALAQFQYKKEIKAEDGVAGRKNNLYGRNGEDNIVQLPLGTHIIDEASGNTIEINNTKTPILLAVGGKGGLGNNALKSALNQSPKETIPGGQGELKKLKLVLKIIADVGLLGLPNAGKSSLLAALTNAKPKIGNYQFTTLEPNLGMLNTITIADNPGLISGANRGKGLGFTFLRHIEKARLLAHCIDVSEVDIEKAYYTIRDELIKYDPVVSEKEEIILLTKSDLVDKDDLQKKLEIAKKLTDTVFAVSVYDPKSLESLKKELKKRVSSLTKAA